METNPPQPIALNLSPQDRAAPTGERTSTTDSHAAKTSIRKVAIASFIGTTVEWYDFFLYTMATALVFDKLFFPNFDPAIGRIAAFGTYAVGFLARPVGGIVCGHYGDKIGRKSMLVLTLLVMGISTFLIGLLPTYATIGVWAPILLVVLRLAQGFGVGGEWGGAVLMAVEHSPKGKRGFYGSWPQTGVPAGLLLATAVFALVSQLSPEQFLAWGWRVTFLLSFLLVGVGLFIRVAVSESKTFTEVKETKSESKMPIFEVLKNHPKSVLLAAGARLAENAAFYIFSGFIVDYATKNAQLPRSLILNAILIGAGLELFTLPLFGAASDKLGRRPVYIAGALFTALLAFPFFWLIDSRSPGLVILALVLALPIAHAAMYGPQASFFSELFGTRVRYSGASLGYQIASIFAGGLAPLAAVTFLAQTGGKPWPVALLVLGMALITVFSVYMAAETAHADISEPQKNGTSK